MRTSRPIALVLVLLLPALSFGKSKTDSLRETVLGELPVKVRSLEPGKTKRAEVTTAFGKALPDSTDEEAYYSTQGGPSSDLTVGFDSDKLKYFAFDIPPSTRKKLELTKIRKLIPDSSFEEAKKAWEIKASSPDAGHEFSVRVPKEGLILRFVEIDRSPLKAIVVWKAGDPAP